MIYLRSQYATAPIEYRRAIEADGLMVHKVRQLAIYTAKGSANTGPTGLTGPTGPPGDVFDTIIASCSNELDPLTVDLAQTKTTFRAPYALDLTNGYIRISLTTACEGGSLIVDVKLNGTTMFTTKVSIDDGEKTSFTASVPAILLITAVPDDAEFTVFVTQIGSSVAGTGLKVAVTGERVIA